MTQAIVYRVLPAVRGWMVQAEGETCPPPSIHDAKSDAVRRAHALARRDVDRVAIHAEDGSIESSWPISTRGRDLDNS